MLCRLFVWLYEVWGYDIFFVMIRLPPRATRTDTLFPYTSLFRSPSFQKISAAVSDIGGSMSHMAIVAREYGLPAVVGTGSATTRIKDGQRIRVDGGRGVVTLLDETAP